MHQVQALTFYLLDHYPENGLLPSLVFRQKHKTGAILPLLGNGDALQQDKLMRYLKQYARTVASLLTACAHLRSTMAHVLKHAQRTVYQPVTLVAVNVHDHAHTTSVVLIVCPVKPRRGAFVSVSRHILS